MCQDGEGREDVCAQCNNQLCSACWTKHVLWRLVPFSEFFSRGFHFLSLAVIFTVAFHTLNTWQHSVWSWCHCWFLCCSSCCVHHLTTLFAYTCMRARTTEHCDYSQTCCSSFLDINYSICACKLYMCVWSYFCVFVYPIWDHADMLMSWNCRDFCFNRNTTPQRMINVGNIVSTKPDTANGDWHHASVLMKRWITLKGMAHFMKEAIFGIKRAAPCYCVGDSAVWSDPLKRETESAKSNELPL